ncbi:MAG: 4-hydroxy-tetrahydrodipicolinate synthase [Intrasporangiaceae bacterium]|nr:4-hydroxy-tetrahydrodipicolinate synthase [Intrasporangiaceae bacterium]
MPSTSPFGRVISAMVTPMRENGSVDLDAAQHLATWLADQGHDGLVINGTTGESPTTTDREKADLVRAVLDAVGDRVKVTAGVGTNVTAHTIELARQAELTGADAVLVVTPYYNKPPQAGVVAHFRAVADATQLPIMVYDIPGRTGTPLSKDTLLTLAEHPGIRAVKDAKADYTQASAIMDRTDLLWYSGDDAANLLHFVNGAYGIVGVTSQVAPQWFGRLVASVVAGDYDRACTIHRRLAPVVAAVMTQTQGAIAAKAGLVHLGRIPGGHVRLPLIPATDGEYAVVAAALDTLGAPPTGEAPA